MAVYTLLLRPNPRLLEAKPFSQNNKRVVAFRSVRCRNNPKTHSFSTTTSKNTVLKNTLSKDHEYKLSWLEELKSAHGWEQDDEKFQDMVDRRCVDNVRMLIVDSVQHAKAGHAGMALGMAEIGYFLYRHVMRFNPQSPKWFNRDRFVLSAGHGCLLQYVCLHLAGFQSVQVQN